tara:strand:+ start:2167 stop:3846 length:1680 start_codon:yes stop_codon:yes gene_type:complete
MKIKNLLMCCLLSIAPNLKATVEFNHPHMIGVYIAPEGIKKIQMNLEPIVEYNGFSLSNFYHPEIVEGTGVKKIEELISDEKILRSMRRVRYQFRKFFNGFYIKNRHNLQYEIKGIDFSAHWKKFEFDVEEVPYEGNKVKFNIKAVADRFKLSIDSASIEDLEHDFLETISAKKIEVGLDSSSIPLEMSLNSSIKLKDNGGLDFEDVEISTNLEEIMLKAGWQSPLKLPRIKIVINGRAAYLNNAQLERSLKKEIPKLLRSMQESATEYIQNKAAFDTSRLLNQKLGKGFAEIINVSAINAPDPQPNDINYEIKHPNYLMGLKLSELNFQSNLFHLGVDGFIVDPKVEGLSSVDLGRLKRSNVDHERFRPDDQDVLYDGQEMAISIHRGFINDMLNKSFKRGYFNSIPVGDDGTSLSLVTSPYIFQKKNPRTGVFELRLKVHTRYTVSGASSMFVRNPIQISFDVILDIETDDNNNMSLVIRGIDANSMNLPERFIRAFTGTVRNSARDLLREQDTEVRGFVLSDNLPIPNEVFGIPLEYNFYTIDKKGNLILYINMDL